MCVWVWDQTDKCPCHCVYIYNSLNGYDAIRCIGIYGYVSFGVIVRRECFNVYNWPWESWVVVLATCCTLVQSACRHSGMRTPSPVLIGRALSIDMAERCQVELAVLLSCADLSLASPALVVGKCTTTSVERAAGEAWMSQSLTWRPPRQQTQYEQCAHLDDWSVLLISQDTEDTGANLK